MTVPRSALFLAAFSLLPLLSPSARADRSSEKTGAAGSSAAYPWETDREHRFLWLHKEEKIGETRFVVKLVPSPGRPGERLLEVRAARSYQRAGVVQQAKGTTHASLAGEPRHYEEQLTVLHATTARRSTQHLTFERSGRNAKVTYVQNGREDRPVVREQTLPEGTFLCASQAVEHWVLFVASLPRRFDSHTVKVFYPDHRKVFTVRLREKGDETIRVGKARVDARRYSFRSGEGELNGSLWIGSDGRLLQISFPETAVRVVLAVG